MATRWWHWCYFHADANENPRVNQFVHTKFASSTEISKETSFKYKFSFKHMKTKT